MLREDNPVAEPREKARRGIVIKFPGRTRVEAAIGPIVEEGVLYGQLMRIGGEDDTAHALLRDGEKTFRCEMSRDLAKRLAAHLYAAPIRVIGRGRWWRTAEGNWELKAFTVRDFEVVDSRELHDLAGAMRKASKFEWRESEDPLGQLMNLRSRQCLSSWTRHFCFCWSIRIRGRRSAELAARP